ncbi:hypothetical protein CAEBREN_22988 [Caenorhabditis brenneri]|uniref:Uncharacterized protein n=1 Tax=Caenorhabditis brenneri TaxID=135651 RepID=G0NQU4_CAEBE|nr:hypothetical protein CAEBREN_22988 [Caenorhabditis brenneri]
MCGKKRKEDLKIGIPNQSPFLHLSQLILWILGRQFFFDYFEFHTLLIWKNSVNASTRSANQMESIVEVLGSIGSVFVTIQATPHGSRRRWFTGRTTESLSSWESLRRRSQMFTTS